MRLIDTALPLLAGLSTLVEAQNVDFGKVYSAKPQLKSASNTGSSTSSVKTSSVASSIVSVLSSQHAATMIQSTSTASSSKKSSSSAKSSSTSKSSATTSSKTIQSASSKSSSKASSSSKPPTTLSTKKATSSTKQSTSSTQKTSSSAAAASNLCPAINNKDVTDSKGKVYTIKCSSDTDVGSFTNKAATNSYADCMTACDATSGCVAFSYVGGDYGSTSGTCWLKNSAGNAIAAGKNYVAGFLKSPKSSSSTAKTSTSTKKVTSTSSKASTSTSTKKTSSTKVKRATATTCSNPNNILYSYVSNPDTPTQFLVDTTLAGLAAAQWYPPAGYSTSFTGQLAGLFAPNYLGYQQLSSYSPSACAAYCNARSDCNAFNIYIQRTPTFIPDDSCPNPSGAAQITCALYGTYVSSSQATNIGQYRKDFMVVIQGSNGYNLNPAPASVSTFQGPNALDAVAYSSSIYLAQKYFSSYDVTQCSSLCNTYTANSKANAQSSKSSTYTPCNYFNVFNLTLNGQSQLMGCYLFSTSDAANYDNYRTARDTNSGTVYNLTNSYGYALYPQDKGLTSVTWTAAPTGKNATCSALGNAGDSYVDYNGVTYTLGCGYDVQYAADIGNQTTPDFYSCFAICDSGAYPGCSGFAYLGNTCYFKNLAGTSRTPQLNNYNVDMAWLPSYAGFNAYTVPGTVSYTTSTTVWAGPGSTTVTTINGLAGTVLVKTSGQVPAATTTTYVTVTVDQGTATTISTQTITPTNGFTGTVSIIYPTPVTTCGNKGAAVGFYSNPVPGYQATSAYPAFLPEQLKTSSPTATATAVSYIAEYNDASNGATVYGKKQTNNQLSTIALNHVFYIFAGHGTGYYYINIPSADDVALFWIGPNALSGYSRANAQLIQSWSVPTVATLGFYLTANTYTPVRLWFANGGGIGGLQFTMLAPDGAQILQSTTNSNAGSMNPDIVMFPCDSSKGKAFPTFGKET
ncbi:hypothetical protein E4T49_05916 [Aureobasidium sp. EXF-10728]|nr:hypothetical protein E4T49_05916 [Aureobasidium sp. EXF-10728]